MKLVFSLAVITKKEQRVEELIKPYIRNNEDLSLCIKEHRNYISGIIFGDFDTDYDSKAVIIKEEKSDKKSETKWLIRERSVSSFKRSFTVPEDVDCEKLTASVKDGVLTVAMPRKALAQPKRIPITCA